MGERGEVEPTARLLKIEGRVQGVGFRWWLACEAERLDLQGYVRNLTDGSVEALLVGDEPSLARMLVLCELGPPSAHVETVRTERVTPEPGAPRGFLRAATAAPGSPVKG